MGKSARRSGKASLHGHGLTELLESPTLHGKTSAENSKAIGPARATVALVVARISTGSLLRRFTASFLHNRPESAARRSWVLCGIDRHSFNATAIRADRRTLCERTNCKQLSRSRMITAYSPTLSPPLNCDLRQASRRYDFDY